MQMEPVDMGSVACKNKAVCGWWHAESPNEDMRESDERFQKDEDDDDRLFGGERSGLLEGSGSKRGGRAGADRRVWVVADVQDCRDKTNDVRQSVRDGWMWKKGFGVLRSRLTTNGFRSMRCVRDKEGFFAAAPPLE